MSFSISIVEGDVVLVDSTTGEPLATISGNYGPTLRVSSDGTSVLIDSYGGYLSTVSGVNGSILEVQDQGTTSLVDSEGGYLSTVSGINGSIIEVYNQGVSALVDSSGNYLSTISGTDGRVLEVQDQGTTSLLDSSGNYLATVTGTLDDTAGRMLKVLSEAVLYDYGYDKPLATTSGVGSERILKVQDQGTTALIDSDGGYLSTVSGNNGRILEVSSDSVLVDDVDGSSLATVTGTLDDTSGRMLKVLSEAILYDYGSDSPLDTVDGISTGGRVLKVSSDSVLRDYATDEALVTVSGISVDGRVLKVSSDSVIVDSTDGSPIATVTGTLDSTSGRMLKVLSESVLYDYDYNMPLATTNGDGAERVLKVSSDSRSVLVDSTDTGLATVTGTLDNTTGRMLKVLSEAVLYDYNSDSPLVTVSGISTGGKVLKVSSDSVLRDSVTDEALVTVSGISVDGRVLKVSSDSVIVDSIDGSSIATVTGTLDNTPGRMLKVLSEAVLYDYDSDTPLVTVSGVSTGGKVLKVSSDSVLMDADYEVPLSTRDDEGGRALKVYSNSLLIDRDDEYLATVTGTLDDTSGRMLKVLSEAILYDYEYDKPLATTSGVGTERVLKVSADSRSVLVDQFDAPLSVVYGAEDDPDAKLLRVYTDFSSNSAFATTTTSGTSYIRVVSENVDAFQRQKVGMPYTLFDSKQVGDNQGLLWSVTTTSGGSVTYDITRSCSILSVTTLSGAKAVRQSKEYFNYQPGKSQSILFTGILGPKKSNVVQRIGYFDDNDGLFFEQDNNSLKAVVRSSASGSVVESKINQANWNQDPLNGNGFDGFVLDTTKTQIFFMDFEWLGAGTVSYGFFVEGVMRYCHRRYFGNIEDKVYIRTPNLPMRYEIENIDTTDSSTEMMQICCSVVSEGSFSPKIFNFAHSTGTAVKVGNNGQRVAVVSIRLKSEYSRRQLLPSGFRIYVQSDSFWELVLNGSLSGTPSWQTISDASVAEGDTAATFVSGGTVIGCGFVSDTIDMELDYERGLKVLSDIEGVSDILTLAVTPSTNSTDITGDLRWKEFM